MLTGESQLQLNNHALTVVDSGQLVKMEMPKVEMGNNTGTAEELWEGLGGEDKEDVDEGNKNEDKGTEADLVDKDKENVDEGKNKGEEEVDKGENEGKDGEEDLVSNTVS